MREGVSLKSASGAVLLALASAGAVASACSTKAGPGDEAMAAYLERHGITPPDVSEGDTASADATGVVRSIARRMAITVERATGLPDLDSGPGETDPYVALDYEGQRFKTSVVEGELEPIWGDTFIMDVRPGGVLIVRLMDEDSLSSDEQVGTQSQVLPDLAVGETQSLVVKFRNDKGGALTLTLTGMVRP